MAILRLERPETAAWASKVFGEFESIELRSTREGAWGQRRARSEERVRSEVLMPSEFMAAQSRLFGRNGRFWWGGKVSMYAPERLGLVANLRHPATFRRLTQSQRT